VSDCLRRRPLRPISRAELVHDDFDVAPDLPDPAVEKARYSLNVALGAVPVRVTQHRVVSGSVSEQHDDRPMLADPIRLNGLPVAAVLLVVIRSAHCLKRDLAGIQVLRSLDLEPALVRVSVPVDPDHRRISVDPRHDDDAVRVPRRERSLAPDAKFSCTPPIGLPRRRTC